MSKCKHMRRISSPQFDLLNLAHKAFQSSDKAAGPVICLQRIQVLFNLAMVLQKLIHGGPDDRQSIGPHELFHL